MASCAHKTGQGTMTKFGSETVRLENSWLVLGQWSTNCLPPERWRRTLGSKQLFPSVWGIRALTEIGLSAFKRFAGRSVPHSGRGYRVAHSMDAVKAIHDDGCLRQRSAVQHQHFRGLVIARGQTGPAWR